MSSHISAQLREQVIADAGGRCAYCQSRTEVIGLTSVGRATIKALQMNRPVIVQLRRYWVALGLHPPG
jgi:hypothetical protein